MIDCTGTSGAGGGPGGHAKGRHGMIDGAAVVAGPGGHGAGDAAHAVRALSDAFAARDLDATLACFAAGDDVGYAGSEQGETATGRAALSCLLTEVFARDEAYAWTATTVTVRAYGSIAYVFAEADGEVRTDAGEREAFPYRVSGVLERADGRWLWRHCQGCEPATPAA
jgi:ketosteroid isomerase-like protein